MMKNIHITLHSQHFKSNIDFIRTQYPQIPELCLAIKSNGYGHGLLQIAELALDNGIHSFSVANTHEAELLRSHGITAHIYLCSLPAKEEISTLVNLGIITLLSDLSFIRLFHEEATKQEKLHPVHIKVDTGMGRLGCAPEDVMSLYEEIARSSALQYGGIATHLSSADMDEEFTDRQLHTFGLVLEEFNTRKVKPGIVHAANSAGFFRFPRAHFHMARIGIAAYGYPPYKSEIFSALRPVMELRSQIIYIKRVPAHTSISYQHSYTSPHACNIATIPVGYGYGINRLLSNNGYVLIAGKRYPIVGIVCMDHLMVNLGDDSYALFTPVTIFGPDSAGASAQSIAEDIGTISYEVMCALSSHIPRTVV